MPPGRAPQPKKWIVELEVTPAEGSLEPGDWFWTDACESPDDQVSVVRVEEVEKTDE